MFCVRFPQNERFSKSVTLDTMLPLVYFLSFFSPSKSSRTLASKQAEGGVNVSPTKKTSTQKDGRRQTLDKNIKQLFGARMTSKGISFFLRLIFIRKFSLSCAEFLLTKSNCAPFFVTHRFMIQFCNTNALGKMYPVALVTLYIFEKSRAII